MHSRAPSDSTAATIYPVTPAAIVAPGLARTGVPHAVQELAAGALALVLVAPF